MLLRFQKAAAQRNYETGNQGFSMRLRFLTTRPNRGALQLCESVCRVGPPRMKTSNAARMRWSGFAMAGFRGREKDCAREPNTHIVADDPTSPTPLNSVPKKRTPPVSGYVKLTTSGIKDLRKLFVVSFSRARVYNLRIPLFLFSGRERQISLPSSFRIPCTGLRVYIVGEILRHSSTSARRDVSRPDAATTLCKPEELGSRT
jgi:hypothetical protein